MPLYEVIMITKPGLAKSTQKILTKVAQTAEMYKCVVRTATVLGDRILSHGGFCKKERAFYSIGRYLQVMIDANPDTMNRLIASTKKDHEIFVIEAMKAKDFYQEIQEQAVGKEEDLFDHKKLIFENDQKSQFEKVMSQLKNDTIIGYK